MVESGGRLFLAMECQDQEVDHKRIHAGANGSSNSFQHNRENGKSVRSNELRQRNGVVKPDDRQCNGQSRRFNGKSNKTASSARKALGISRKKSRNGLNGIHENGINLRNSQVDDSREHKCMNRELRMGANPSMVSQEAMENSSARDDAESSASDQSQDADYSYMPGLNDELALLCLAHTSRAEWEIHMTCYDHMGKFFSFFLKSCQVDLVKDGGHQYFIKFLDSTDVYAEQRAMAAFVLAVIVDGHRGGQEACVEAGLINVCLRHIQSVLASEVHHEPLLLQWLCLCLGKLWEGFSEARLLGLQENASTVLFPLLFEPQPEVRASAVYALGTLVDVGNESIRDGLVLNDDDADGEKMSFELEIAKHLLKVLSDGSPLVRAELAIALSRFAVGHNKHLKSMAAAYLKPPSNSMLTSFLSFVTFRSPTSSRTNPSQFMSLGGSVSVNHGSVLRGVNDGPRLSLEGRVAGSSPLLSSGMMHGSSSSDCSSHHSEESKLLINDTAINGNLRPPESKAVYAQCVAAMYALARDPFPRVANFPSYFSI